MFVRDLSLGLFPNFDNLYNLYVQVERMCWVTGGGSVCGHGAVSSVFFAACSVLLATLSCSRWQFQTQYTYDN